MERYPNNILSERETLERALAGRSIARFGDGELRLAMGPPAKQCKTQCHHPDMQQELRRLLQGNTRSLICLPRLHRGLPDFERHWQSFLDKRSWAEMIADVEYGSSFITRPDNVPDIDTVDYWDKMRKLWQGKDVVLVIGKPPEGGKDYSLTPSRLQDANSVRVVYGRQRDAYVDIDNIERAIVWRPTYPGVVLLCLGTTATCLAERIAQRGIHALDLGHLGRFMRRGQGR